MKLPAASDPVAGLVLIDDASGWHETVCGLSVLARAVAGLDRAGTSVFVPAADRLSELQRQRLLSELGAMPRRPDVRLSAMPPSLARLVVVSAPGVFDPRIVERVANATGTTVENGGDVVAWQRPAARLPPFLWVANGASAAEIASLARESEAAASRLAAAPRDLIDPGAGLCDRVDETALPTIGDKLFAQARKSSDTWVARHIDRPISLAVTRRLVGHPITPNQITVAATLIGLGGAVLLGLGTYASQLLGALLVTAAIIVDGCDGEVARIKFMESEFGRKLDFFLDNVVNVAAIFAVGAGHAWQGGATLYLVASALAAVAAAAAVLPVYALFFREAKQAVELGAPTGGDPAGDPSLAALVEAIAGRDFAYLILLLAIFGRAHWFALICVAGIVVFLVALVVVYARRGSSTKDA